MRRPPPLEGGDRLTRLEFERRYDAMPGLKNEELIEGIVYTGSTVRFVQHGEPHLKAPNDLLAGNLAGLFAMIDQGVQSAEHAVLLTRLASAK